MIAHDADTEVVSFRFDAQTDHVLFAIEFLAGKVEFAIFAFVFRAAPVVCPTAHEAVAVGSIGVGVFGEIASVEQPKGCGEIAVALF